MILPIEVAESIFVIYPEKVSKNKRVTSESCIHVLLYIRRYHTTEGFMNKSNLITVFSMIAVSFILILSACSQPSLPLGGFFTVMDAENEKTTHGFGSGNPDYTEQDGHFFFLPPLALKPEFSGTFAADLEPVVKVSIRDEEDIIPVVEYTVDGRGSEKVRIESSDELGEFYIVNFHIKKYDIPLGARLLIEVFSDDMKLGDITAIVIANGSEKSSGYDDDAYPLVMNRTVPIKFRIEEEFFKVVIPGRIEVWGSPSIPLELLDVPEYEDFISLALGTYHGIGLRQDGTLVSWGRDTYGQISGTPAGTGFIAVDTGLLYSIVLHEDGTVYSWGGGLCSSIDYAPAGTGFSDISAGYGFALALNEAGEISGWSLSDPILATLPSGSGYVDIRAGSYIALAIDSLGGLELFGISSTGVLGADVPPGAFLYADAEYYNAAGILSDGRLVSWGGNDAVYFDLVQDFNDGPYRLVALGKTLGVGLRSDGTLRPFGDSAVVNEIPVDRNGFVAIAANQLTAVAAISRVSD